MPAHTKNVPTPLPRNPLHTASVIFVVGVRGVERKGEGHKDCRGKLVGWTSWGGADTSSNRDHRIVWIAEELFSPEPAAHGNFVLALITSSSASLEELRACQSSCHRRRTFVFSPPVSKSKRRDQLLLEEVVVAST